MLCAHCDDRIAPRHTVSLRFDGGIKCPACGRIVYIKIARRRDPASVFILLGFVAAFSFLLYIAGEVGGRTAFITALCLGIFGLFVSGVVSWVLAIEWSRTVSSLPPQEIQRRKRFNLGTLLYLGSVAAYFTVLIADANRIYGLVALLVGLVLAIFNNRHSQPVEH